jgi:hypothetical protein
MKAGYTQAEILAFAKFMGMTATEADIARWQGQTTKGAEARIRHRVSEMFSPEFAEQAHKEALQRNGVFFI